MSDIKYSQYGLINEELSELNERGIINRIFNFIVRERRLRFNIEVPNELYLRAEILCKDVVERSKKNNVYTQGELVEHVFLDFLDEVREADGNLRSIYNKLKVRIEELPMVNDHPLIPRKSKTSVFTSIDREDVLRAEVLLKDLSYFSNHGLTVEKLIEIVYIDFLVEYQKDRRKNVMNEILEYID